MDEAVGERNVAMGWKQEAEDRFLRTFAESQQGVWSVRPLYQQVACRPRVSPHAASAACWDYSHQAQELLGEDTFHVATGRLADSLS